MLDLALGVVLRGAAAGIGVLVGGPLGDRTMGVVGGALTLAPGRRSAGRATDAIVRRDV